MVTLYQGDCLEVMKDMQDECIDLTVTSPPYDNLRTYNGNIEQWSFEKFQNIAKELFRITKQGGVVVWIVADATVDGSETSTSFKQALYFKECGFRLFDTMIWNKGGCGNLGALNRYVNVFEYMFVFSKGAPKSINLIRDKPNKLFGKKRSGCPNRKADGTMYDKSWTANQIIQQYGKRHNIWDVTPCLSNSERLHSAPFPVRLAQDHVISWSSERDTVLDCFMGSGSTGVACVNTNRNFIGIELDEHYFEVAKSRIEQAQKQK